MKYLEIIPDFLSMYGVFTSPNTSQVRQEMSNNSFWGALKLTKPYIILQYSQM